MQPLSEIHERSQTQEVGDDLIVKIIHQCARCDLTHENVVFHRFTQAMMCDGIVYGYWAICPTNGEPIIMGRTKEQEREVRRVSNP